jgi:hypothetical protein
MNARGDMRYGCQQPFKEFQNFFEMNSARGFPYSFTFFYGKFCRKRGRGYSKA